MVLKHSISRRDVIIDRVDMSMSSHFDMFLPNGNVVKGSNHFSVQNLRVLKVLDATR